MFSSAVALAFHIVKMLTSKPWESEEFLLRLG